MKNKIKKWIAEIKEGYQDTSAKCGGRLNFWHGGWKQLFKRKKRKKNE